TYLVLKAIMKLKLSTIGWLLIAHISIALASNAGRAIARVRADTPQATGGATDTARVVPLGGQCAFIIASSDVHARSDYLSHRFSNRRWARLYRGPTTCQL